MTAICTNRLEKVRYWDTNVLLFVFSEVVARLKRVPFQASVDYPAVPLVAFFQPPVLSINPK